MAPVGRTLVGPTREEFRSMLRATFRRADDRVVERARLGYVAVLAAWIAWVILSPIAVQLTR
jgi:hypothetical protein